MQDARPAATVGTSQRGKTPGPAPHPAAQARNSTASGRQDAVPGQESQKDSLPGRPPGPAAPLYGEDNEVILTGLLGTSADEVAELTEQGVPQAADKWILLENIVYFYR